jgi:hypothetical protein
MQFHYPGGGSSFRPIPTANKPVSPSQPGIHVQTYFGGEGVKNILSTPITHDDGFSSAQNIIKPVFGSLGQTFKGFLPGTGYKVPKGGFKPL